MFDRQAYLTRIGLAHVDLARPSSLASLHRAHIAAIPFENLDIQMGRPIALDAGSIQSALVGRRRGGYCFQQNGLFRMALQAMGYEPRPHQARVVDASGAVLPRTHMVLTVCAEGVDWLVDVGFGGHGIVEPIRLDGHIAIQDGWSYRLVWNGRLRVLQRAGTGGWDDLYEFGDDEAQDVDYLVGNWFTSTHPDSKFVRNLIVHRMVGARRYILRNLTYSVAADGGEWQVLEVRREELVPLLREVFDLDVPDDARFRALDAGPAAGSSRI
ncbi:MAG: arylamine N-acetyltransferase [Acidobacteriota bacterium]